MDCSMPQVQEVLRRDACSKNLVDPDNGGLAWLSRLSNHNGYVATQIEKGAYSSHKGSDHDHAVDSTIRH
jgi:hypothetical protein